jgi:MFS transporter, DHA3 family, macrolide efflux protein
MFSRDRNLMLLAAGQLASRLGDVSFHIGLLWLILKLTGSREITGLVAMVEYLPILLFGLVAGVLVDRLDRRRVMLWTSLIRFGLMLILPLAVSMGSSVTVICAAVAFGLALATSLFTPARDALVPVLVGEDGDRVRANALVQGSDQLAWFMGPLLAAILLELLGKEKLFLGSALMFLVGWICLKLMKLPADQPLGSNPEGALAGGEPGGAPAARIAWREARQGLSMAWGHRGLRWLLIITAVNNFFIMGPAIVAMPIYIGDDLGLPGRYFGFIESVLALGMMISSVLIVRWRPRIGKGKIWLAGMVLDGLTYGPILMAPKFPVLVPLILGHALFIPWISIFRISIVQDLVPPEMQGRVFSLVGMAVVGMTALSCGVTGLMLGRIPTHLLFGIWGLLGMICGLVGWFSKDLRRL